MFEKQYFSSQIITSAIVFLTNGKPEGGSRGGSAPGSHRRAMPCSQPGTARPPLGVPGKGSLELKQMVASAHSILMACHRVSHTYVTTHFLI